MVETEAYLPNGTSSLHELWSHVTACHHSHHCYTEQHAFASDYLLTAAAAAAAAVMWKALTAAHADLQLMFLVG